MNQTKLTPLPTGDWGGSGIRLTVEEKGAKIEYGCADGEITQKVYFDQKGRFTGKGVHIRISPGPTREDMPPERQPAQYTGSISGNSMILKVILTATGASVGEFTLQRGKNVRVTRCL